MTYQREHLTPILWSGSFQNGNTGTSGPGSYPAYIQLIFPKDTRVGDKLLVYYTGYALAADQTPGFHFSKMNIAAAATTITTAHDTNFDTNQQIDGDTAFQNGLTNSVTGLATLTIIAELVTWVAAGKPIGLTHYNTTSTGWIYVFDWTILLERA